MYKVICYERLVHKSGKLILDSFYPHSCDFEKLSEALQYVKHRTELYRNKENKTIYCNLLDEIVCYKYLKEIYYEKSAVRYSYILDSPTYAMSSVHNIGLVDMKDVTYELYFVWLQF